jgi:ArsR family transcriptional regulator, arsenate/arsenite/antimonite-responsive transcriptional repressor
MNEKLSAGEQFTIEEAVAVLQALADANRLRILDLLMQGDSCNCELKEQLGLPPNLLSHHLRALRQAGLVRSRRDAVDGRWIYYMVSKESLGRWRDWFQAFLDPARVRERLVLCGPEGQQAAAGASQDVLYCGTPTEETEE